MKYSGSSPTTVLTKIRQAVQALQFYSRRWWYTPLMGVIVFLALFIPVLPSDPIVVKTFLLKPKRWWLTAIFFAFCSALSATLLAYLVARYGETLITKITGPEFFLNPKWLDAKKSISEFGAAGLFLFALSPIPQQPAVFAAGLAEIPLLKVFGAVLLGRTVKFGFYGALFLLVPGGIKRGREFFRSRPRSKEDRPNQS